MLIDMVQDMLHSMLHDSLNDRLHGLLNEMCNLSGNIVLFLISQISCEGFDFKIHILRSNKISSLNLICFI